MINSSRIGRTIWLPSSIPPPSKYIALFRLCKQKREFYESLNPPMNNEYELCVSGTTEEVLPSILSDFQLTPKIRVSFLVLFIEKVDPLKTILLIIYGKSCVFWMLFHWMNVMWVKTMKCSQGPSNAAISALSSVSNYCNPPLNNPLFTKFTQK